MVEDFQFRFANLEDREALIDLKHEINRVEHSAYLDIGCVQRVLDLSRDAAAAGVDDYFAHIEQFGGAFLVVERGGKIVGCGCWYGEQAAVSTKPEFRPQANIGGIVVVPSARGTGLGKMIMFRLEELIKAAGIEHARLTVVPGNQPAQNLYEGLGFEPFELTMIKRLG